jgi:AcrR family transcriptional regulator
MISKKISIKKTGQMLFFKHGHSAVRVEQICQKANVCKRTFYKYYANKTSLVISILADFCKKENDIFLKYKDSNLTFKNKILSILEDKIKLLDSAEAKFFIEILEQDGEIKDFASKKIAEGDREFFKFVSDEQNKGNVRKDISARLISYMLTNKLREIVFDPEIGKMVPNLSERLDSIVKILLTGLINEEI